MITFECPYCHHEMKASDEHGGKKAKCTKCSLLSLIPEADIPEALADKNKAFDSLPPMKLDTDATSPEVPEPRSKLSWKGFILIMLGISLVCFFYFLLRSNYYPIGDGSMSMYSGFMAESRINGMIGSGVAIAVCFATLFYLKINSRNAEAGQ